MANATIKSRTRFLTAAASHYALVAPASSAHFISQCNAYIAGNGLPVDHSRLNATCKGCGTILIPGWTSRTSITNKSPMKDRKPQSKICPKNKTFKPQSKYLRIDCLLCYRFEELPLNQSRCNGSDTPKTVNTPAPLTFTEQSTSTSTAVQHTPKATASNATSKQRAKARKQSGLQAMLEKSKASTGSSTGSGLDLLDLMKQD